MESDAIKAVKRELAEAQALWPAMRSPHEGFAILQEEVDELWALVKVHQKDPDLYTEHMKKEAIQVAAMAIRFLIDCT